MLGAVVGLYTYMTTPRYIPERRLTTDIRFVEAHVIPCEQYLHLLVPIPGRVPRMLVGDCSLPGRVIGMKL